jgi:hypothetical protein
MKASRGVLIASAAAGLILAGGIAAKADHHEKAGGDKVHCAGVNECKGKGSCATGESSCAGMNACKGKGVVEMGKEECLKKGGKVEEKKM